MEYGITEECRGAKSNHQSVDVLVDSVELAIFLQERQKDDPKKRTGTDHDHHEKAIAISCGEDEC